MPGNPRLVDLVQERIVTFLADHDDHLATIAPDLLDLTVAIREFVSGGKRFRARFCYWGWAAVSRITEPVPLDDAPSGAELEAVISAAAGLELFHAAALVHDDLMDNSDLRRGRPSLHRRFETLHRQTGWAGDPAEYGRSTALLIGDVLIIWSDELATEAFASLRPEHALPARREYARMRSEVSMGQYLDMLEEVSWASHPDSDALDRALRVVVYKSAKYSVESPLALGATMAGADAEQLAALRGFGLPLGVAFQLRDDLLGVFGDEEATGKPAGDDLREGKRTVLVALAREALPPTALRLVDELLGDPGLGPEQVEMLQSTFQDSGAVDRVERIIARQVEQARAALADARIAPSARAELLALADAVAQRDR